MTSAFQFLGDPGASILLIADHASNAVPNGIDLGLPAHVMHEHIALDIGVARLAELLVRNWDCCAILGGVSRLVIDYNREPNEAALVPVQSDGYEIEANKQAEVGFRRALFYDPYHKEVARLAAMPQRPFLLSLHSFTPVLKTAPNVKRPWEIGVLYNEDDRAANIAVPLLEQAGLVVGEQQPYSGKELNATMNRHAENHGRPYLGVEIRQDMIAGAKGQHRIAEILGPVLAACRDRLA
jgi:predicted N-formylglutamate amidohydrolase